MALQIRRTSPIKVRIITTLMMAFALVAQPFAAVIASQPAYAAGAETLYDNATRIAIGNGSFLNPTVDASGHHDLKLSFAYDGENMDDGDSFDYGWSVGSSAVTSLGSVAGHDEGTTGDESGNVVDLPLPAAAEVANLQIHFKNNSNSGDDSVKVSDVVVTGVPDVGVNTSIIATTPTTGEGLSGSNYTFSVTADLDGATINNTYANFAVDSEPTVKVYEWSTPTDTYPGDAGYVYSGGDQYAKYNLPYDISGLSPGSHSVTISVERWYAGLTAPKIIGTKTVNFTINNSAPSPEITSISAEYVNVPGEYTGIYVGFKEKDITTATDVELRINRDDGTQYSIHAKQPVLDAVNATSTEYGTGGTVIVTGERTSGSWDPQTGTWTGSSRVKTTDSVEVLITLQNGDVIKETLDLESDITAQSNEAAVFAGVPAAPADTNAPVIELDTPADNDFVKGDVEFTGSVYDNEGNFSYYYYHVTGPENVGSITVYGEQHDEVLNGIYPGQGSWDTTEVPDGDYIVHFLAVDSKGNVATKNLPLTVDNTLPQMQNLKMYVKDNAGDYVEYNVVKPGDHVRIDVEATDQNIENVEFRIQADAGDYVASRKFIDTPHHDNVYRYEFQIPVDGEYINTHNPMNEDLNGHAFWVRAHDSAGNYHSGLKGDFTFDITAPDGSFDVSSGHIGGTTTIKVDLTAVGAAGLGQQQVVLRDASGVAVGNWQYNVETGATRVVTGNGTFNYTGDDRSGTLNITFDTAGLNGIYNLKLFTKDQLGNGRSNIYGQLKVDNVAPSVRTAEIVAPAGATVYKDSIVIRHRVKEANSLDSLKFYFAKPNAAGVCDPNESKALGPISAHLIKYTAANNIWLHKTTVDTSSLNGTYCIFSVAEDEAMNHSDPQEKKFKATFDNQGPAVSLTSPAGQVSNNNSITVTGTVDQTDISGVDRVLIQVKNGTTALVIDTDSSPKTILATVTGDTWEATIPANMLPEGVLTIVAIAKDGLGNTKTDTQDITVDNTAPTLSNLTAAQNLNGTYTLSVMTNDPTAPVTFTLDGVALSGATFFDNGDGTATWSVVTGVLEQATPHTFGAVSTDSVSNSSAESSSFTVPVIPSERRLGNVAAFIDPRLPDTNTGTILGGAAATETTPVTLEGDDEEGILGAQDSATTPLETPAVVTPSAEGWKIFGIAWYWWLLILAAIAALWSFLAARRRRAEENAS